MLAMHAMTHEHQCPAGYGSSLVWTRFGVENSHVPLLKLFGSIRIDDTLQPLYVSQADIEYVQGGGVQGCWCVHGVALGCCCRGSCCGL